MSFVKVQRVAIIGAGVAGLATARQLIARGIECTVFERTDRLGGVWAAGYAGFGAQVQKELYEFPDYPLPEGTSDFTSGPVIQEYLEEYAQHFGVWPHVRFGASVTEVREQPNAKGRWTVVSEQSGRRMEEGFDLLVVATGLYSGRPHLPAFPGQEHFRGQVLHVSQVRSRDQLQERKVVVVGYGKSATDVALESAAVADNTTMVFREPHWPVPPRLLGILPFKWAMLSRLTSALIPPYYRASRAERVAHSLGRPLVWLWWRLVELLLIGQCKLGSRFGTRVSLVPSQPVEIDTFGEAVMLPRPEFFNDVRNGGIQARRTEIARFTESGVILATGETLEADVVVMGTGWRTSYAYLPADVRARIGFEPDGFYLYRHMVPAQVPGLVFIGSASTIESIATYSLQARWLIELIQGTHGLPSGPEMQRDVEEVKAWKRRWMPFSPARGARLLLHMLHYHDQLLADMGIESRRKQGAFAPFKEVFAPYQPSDYRSVAAGDEEAAATGLRQRGNTATDRAA